MTAFASLLSAFGLSGAAGLNAYIPLLAVAILGRMGVFHLAKPYDFLEAWWMIALLSVLTAVELVIDKLPVADHLNDLIQTFIRPVAGAILFAASAGFITDLNPYIPLVIGLVLALGVHGAKATARPVVNASTVGFGAPVASAIENIVTIILTFLAIFLPIVAGVFLLLLLILTLTAFILFRKAFSKKRHPAPASTTRPAAPPIIAPARITS